MSKKRNTRSTRAAGATRRPNPDDVTPRELPAPRDSRATDPGMVWVAWDWWDSRVVGYLVTRRDSIDDLIAFVRAEGVTAREEPDRELYEVAMNVASNPDLAARLPEAMDLREHGLTAEGPAVPPFIYALWCHRENGHALQHHPGVRPNPYCRRRERDTLVALFDDCFDADELHTHPVRGLHLQDGYGGGKSHGLWSTEYEQPKAA